MRNTIRTFTSDMRSHSLIEPPLYTHHHSSKPATLNTHTYARTPQPVTEIPGIYFRAKSITTTAAAAQRKTEERR